MLNWVVVFFSHVCGRLAKGDPSCCLPIVSYTFTSFSTAVAEHLVELGIELTGKNDLSFMESVYKVKVCTPLVVEGLHYN